MANHNPSKTTLDLCQYIIEMQDRKLSVLLGTCHLMFEKFGKYDETVKYISTIDNNFYIDYLDEKRLQQ